MSRCLEFSHAASFMKFLDHEATRVVNWQDTVWWKLDDSAGFRIALPVETDLHIPADARIVDEPPTAAIGAPRRLGELWKSARPVSRANLAAAIPHCWMLLIDVDAPGLYDAIIETAPAMLQMLEFRLAYSPEAPVGRAFIVHGTPGQMLAHQPPLGCRSFECDELPGGGLAAFPIGWTLPSLPDQLWPQTNASFLLYTIDHAGTHSAHALEVTQRTPLSALIGLEARGPQLIGNPLARLDPVPWRVLPHRGPHNADRLDSERQGAVPAVFRLRTYDRGLDFRLEALDAPAEPDGHDLGHALLQVLDEAEAGILPEFAYAAADAIVGGTRQRWHFLHSEQVDARLKDAWNAIERFDYIHELASDDLHVFVSTSSQMSPPLQAVLDTTADRPAVVQRLRKLLGNPGPSTMVLIEADPVAEAFLRHGRSSPPNPIVTHIDRAAMIPLAEVLRTVVKDWHNLAPLRALAESTTPASVQTAREAYERTLAGIAKDEHDELQRAADEGQKALGEWARRAQAALEESSVPVRDARQVCQALTSALSSGEASMAAACSALAGISRILTEPRRAWIREQTIQAANALREVAPTLADMESVRERAAKARSELQAATAQLRNATEALQELSPQIAAADANALEASTHASTVRAQVARRASEVRAHIAVQLEVIRARAREVAAERQQVEAEKARLAAESARVAEIERDNAAQKRSNESLRADLTSRRANAEREHAEVLRIRDTEIPRLRREAETAESVLRALNPERIAADHADVERRLNDTRAKIERAKGENSRIEAARSSLYAETKVAATVLAELAQAQDQTQAAKKELQDKKAAIKHATDGGRRKKAAIKQLRIANKALAEIEWLQGSPGYWGRMKRFLGGKG